MSEDYVPTQNEYILALDVLEQFATETNFLRDITWELAKSHPKILVEMAVNKGFVTDQEAQLQVIIMRATGKIRAIKEVRAITGWGLKDSKEYVEKVRQNW